jgi:hypothetical protein
MSGSARSTLGVEEKGDRKAIVHKPLSLENPPFRPCMRFWSPSRVLVVLLDSFFVHAVATHASWAVQRVVSRYTDFSKGLEIQIGAFEPGEIFPESSRQSVMPIPEFCFGFWGSRTGPIHAFLSSFVMFAVEDLRSLIKRYNICLNTH